MAAFLKVTATWFVLLLNNQFTVGQLAPVSPAPDSVYDAMNFSRRKDLPVKLPVLVKDPDLVNLVMANLPHHAGDNCRSAATMEPWDIGGIVVMYGSKKPSPDFTAIIDQILDKGLETVKVYPTEKWASDRLIWGDRESANFGYLLMAASNRVGCAYTLCDDNNLLSCVLEPLTEVNQHVFSEAFYNGVKNRATRRADMKQGGNNPSVGGSTNDAIPSFLLVGLSAALTLFSSRGTGF